MFHILGMGTSTGAAKNQALTRLRKVCVLTTRKFDPWMDSRMLENSLTGFVANSTSRSLNLNISLFNYAGNTTVTIDYQLPSLVNQPVNHLFKHSCHALLLKDSLTTFGMVNLLDGPTSDLWKMVYLSEDGA